MARPPSRRPGYNRKAQYGLFAGYVAAIAGVVLGLLLVIASAFDPPGFAVLRAGAATLTRPVSAALARFVSGIGTLDEQVVAFWRAGSQNAALRRQVDANRTRLIEASAIAQENQRLKRLLRLADSEAGGIAARLISSTASSARRLARIDVGTMRGVGTGMPVRAPEGLIGRVFASAPATADILLITDPQNIVPVRRTRDNIAAISTGRGDGTVEIRALNSGANPFRPGDIMVTSGTGGVYRPNIPVAIVLRSEGDLSIAAPLANPARVELVLVQAPFQPPQGGPPAAAPAASPAAEAAD